MHIPARYSPIVFGALLSLIMVAVVSAVVLATSRGIDSEFASRWVTSCLTTWPIAFPTVTLIAPWVRKLVGQITR